MALQNVFGNLALDATMQAILTELNQKLEAGQAVALDAPTLAALESVTAAVSGTVALDASTLAALESITATIGNLPADYPDALAVTRLTSILAALSSVAVTGPLTDAQLRATAVPVSGPLTDTQARATPLPVSLTSTTVTGTVGIRGVDGAAIAALANPVPMGAPQELDAGNTATITNTAATFTGAWKRTRSLGLVEQQTVFASNVATGLGATVTFQYSENGSTPTVNEVRPIAAFPTVRNLQLMNVGEWYRIIVTPSRALTAAEFIYVTTQHNRLPGGTFARLADQSTERGFAAMGRTFAYLKGFDSATGLDANVAVSAAGTLAVQETLSWPALTLAGKGYACAVVVSVPLTTEQDIILFRNTAAAGGKLVRLYEQLIATPDSSSATRAIIRVYKNPTITTNGTTLAAGGLRNGQVAAVGAAFTTPTISARGTLIQAYGAVNSPTQRLLDLARYVEPGDSILVTAQPSALTTNLSFVQAWAEVTQ